MIPLDHKLLMSTRTGKALKRRGRTASVPRSVPISRSSFQSGYKTTLELSLHYSEQFRLTPSTSAAYYLFRANDLFDPNYTGTGHQPLGFDQYMLFYNHFVVLSSVCDVFVVSESTSPTVGAYWLGLRLGASTTTYSTISEFHEDPYACAAYVHCAPHGGTSLKSSFDCSKFFGLDRQTLLAAESHWGSAAVSPSEDAYFQIAVFSQNPGTSDAVAVPISVVIRYEVLLSEPKLLAQS